MNEVIQIHRQKNPSDQRSDDELTYLYGKNYPGKFDGYEQFSKDLSRIQQEIRDATAPGLMEEFGRGAARGGRGLLSTGAGALSLLSKSLGADGAADFYAEIAGEQAQKAAENEATVPSYKNVDTFGRGVRYLIGGAGEVLPSIGEAIVATGIGAAAGSASAGPGPGTVGGIVSGIAFRQAAKNLAKRGVKQVTQEALRKEAKKIGAKYGTGLTALANSYALSAGEIYSDLVENEDADPDKAMNAAWLGGLVAAVPDSILPATVVSKAFGPRIAKEAANSYVNRLVKEAAKDVPVEAITEGFQEFVNIAASRYAEGREVGRLTPEERERLVNASFLGAIGGSMASPLGAVRAGEKVYPGQIEDPSRMLPSQGYVPPEVETEGQSEAVPPQRSAATGFSMWRDLVDDSVRKQFFADLSDQDLADIETMARSVVLDERGIGTGLTPEARQYVKSLTGQRKQAFDHLYSQIQDDQTGVDSDGINELLNDIKKFNFRHQGAIRRGLRSVGLLPENAESLQTPPEEISNEELLAQLEANQQTEDQTDESQEAPAPTPRTFDTSSIIAMQRGEMDPPPFARQAIAQTQQRIEQQRQDDAIQKQESTQSTAPVQEQAPEPLTKESKENQKFISQLQRKIRAEEEELANLAKEAAEPYNPDEIKPKKGKKVETAKERAARLSKSQNAALARKAKLERQIDFVENGTQDTIPLDQIINHEADAGDAKRTVKGKVEVVSRVPSFTEKLPSEEYTDELAVALTDRTTVDKTDSKQHPMRVTAFERQDGDGEVVVVGTMRYASGKSGTHTWVVDPENPGGRNIRLKDFLEQKTEDGDQKWVPVASILLSTPTKNFVRRFADAKDFESQAVKPIKTEIARVAKGAEERRRKLQQANEFGDDAGVPPVDSGDATQVDFDPQEGEYTDNASGNQEDEYTESDETDHPFTKWIVSSLWEIVAGTKQFKAIPIQTLEDAVAVLTVLQERYAQEYMAMVKPFASWYAAQGLPFDSFPQTLKEWASQAIYEAGQKDRTGFYSSLLQRGIEEEGGGNGQGSDGNLPGSVSFRRPEGEGSATSQDVRVAYQSIVESLARYGIDVRQVRAGIDRIAGELATQGMGAYDRLNRVVMLALNDANSPSIQEFTTLIHETVHVLFADLPVETRNRIINGIRSATDAEINLISDDPRISQDNPFDMDVDTLHEERLAEAIADQGFTPEESQGIASRIWGAIKEMFFRAAMWIQEAAFGQPSPQMAMRFMRQRLQNFASSPTGMKESLGLNALLPEYQASRFFNPGHEGFDIPYLYNPQTGQMEFQEVEPDSDAAIAFNVQHVYSRPSLVSAKMDSDYMDAVNRGDLITAQRLVDEAAAMAGYKVKSYQGFTYKPGQYPGYVYEMDSKSSTASTTLGFYSTDNRRYANAYGSSRQGREGEVRTLFLKQGRPLVLQKPFYSVSDLRKILEGAGVKIPDVVLREWKQHEGGKPKETWLLLSGLHALNGKEFTESLREALISAGIDSVSHGMVEGGNAFIEFYPNSIKSAEPAAYNNNGVVIPLSQRFRSESNDIRFRKPSKVMSRAESAIGSDTGKSQIEADVASFNEAEDIIQAIMADSALAAEFAKTVDRDGNNPSAEEVRRWYSSLTGVTYNPDKVESYKTQAARSEVEIDPNVRLMDVPEGTLRGTATRKLIKALKGASKKISDRLAKGKASLEKNEKVAEKLNDQLVDVQKRFTDADALAGEAKKKVAEFLGGFTGDMRKQRNLARKLGVLSQQIKELEADEKTVGPTQPYRVVVNRLAKEINGSPDKFADILMAVAELGIDWRATKASEAKKIIKENAESNPIFKVVSGSTRESKALLAIVVAFGKSNQLRMDALANRQEKRAEVLRETRGLLNAAIKDGSEDLKETRKAVASAYQNVKYADRMAREIARIKKRLRQIKAEEEEYKKTEGELKSVATKLYTEADKYSGQLGAILNEFSGAEGETILMPKKKDQDVRSIANSPETFTLPRTTAEASEALNNYVVKMQQWLDANPDKEGGAVYETIKRQVKAIKLQSADTETRSIRDRAMNRVFQNIGAALEGIGIVEGRQLKVMISKFVSYSKGFVERARAAGADWSAAKRTARKVAGIGRLEFNDLFYQRALQFLESRPDLQRLAEDGDIEDRTIWTHVLDHLKGMPDTKLILERGGKPLESSLRKFWHETERNNRLHDKNIRQGMGLKVEDNKTGTYRETVGHPAFTVPRGLDRSVSMFLDAMKNLNWSEMSELFEDLEKNASAILSMFTPDIISNFVEPMVNNPRSMFSSIYRDGSVLASYSNIRSAWAASGGNVLEFASNLYDMQVDSTFDEEIHMSKEEYIQDILTTFSEYAKTLKNVADKSGSNSSSGFRSPHSAIDARIAEDFPNEWLRYVEFDQNHAGSYVYQQAVHAAFGRDGANFDKAVSRADKQLELYAADWERFKREAEEELSDKPAHIRIRDGQKLAEKKAKDAGYDVNTLKNAHLRRKTLNSSKDALHAWYNTHQGDIVEGRAFLEMLNASIGLMVQGLKTVLIDTMTMFEPVLVYGLNKKALKDIKNNWTAFAGSNWGSLMELFGKQSKRELEMAIRRRDLGFMPSDTMSSLSNRVRAILEADDRGTFLSKLLTGARVIQESVLHSGMSKTKVDERLSPTVSPWAPFTYASQHMNFAVIEGAWKAFSDLVGKAHQYMKENPSAYNDPNFKFKAEDVGFVDGWLFKESGAFDVMQGQLSDFGMTLEGLARASIDREKETEVFNPFTNEQWRDIGILATSVLNSESSLISRPRLFLSPAMRFFGPLLGWSFARVEKLLNAYHGKDGEGGVPIKNKEWKRTLAHFGKILAATMPLGIAYSLLADWYDEELLGKKSNIQGFGEGNNLEAMVERLSRVGTFGLVGDIANAGLNFAKDGDLRGVSFDHRVVFLNQLNSLLTLAGTVGKQGGTITYETVGRPLAYALGGAGYLQYAQILNNALSLDNEEARVTARINVGNYLRAVGRELKMDVRQGSGQTAMPNRVKPYVKKMVLAIYANDRAAFEAARVEAEAAAVKEGKDDPADYVMRSLQAYHPLKFVFRTTPSETEYRRILSALPEDGRQDVSQAVSLYDSYLGQSVFKKSSGSTKKNKGFSFRLGEGLQIREPRLPQFRLGDNFIDPLKHFQFLGN